MAISGGRYLPTALLIGFQAEENPHNGSIRKIRHEFSGENSKIAKVKQITKDVKNINKLEDF